MSNHWSSPWRTTGPSGSLEMISGRMTWSLALRQLELLGIELRHVGGEHVAAARFVGLDGLVGGAERDDLVLHVVGAEVVGEIELGGGAGLRADEAPLSSSAELTLSALRTMKPWPS